MTLIRYHLPTKEKHFWERTISLVWTQLNADWTLKQSKWWQVRVLCLRWISCRRAKVLARGTKKEREWEAGGRPGKNKRSRPLEHQQILVRRLPKGGDEHFLVLIKRGTTTYKWATTDCHASKSMLRAVGIQFFHKLRFEIHWDPLRTTALGAVGIQFLHKPRFEIHWDPLRSIEIHWEPLRSIGIQFLHKGRRRMSWVAGVIYFLPATPLFGALWEYIFSFRFGKKANKTWMF